MKDRCALNASLVQALSYIKATSLMEVMFIWHLLLLPFLNNMRAFSCVETRAGPGFYASITVYRKDLFTTTPLLDPDMAKQQF